MEAGQFHALPCKAIQDRGPDPGVTVTGKIMVTEVVRHDEDDVGAVRAADRDIRDGEGDGKEGEKKVIRFHAGVGGVT